MPGSDVIVKIVLGLSIIISLAGIIVWVLSSLRREGRADATSDILKDSAKQEQEREKKAKEERVKSNRDWISSGRK